MITEKTLPRRNPNNPQIREYIDAIERGKDTLHIFPGDGGWTLKKIGGENFGVFETQKAAISSAEKILRGGGSAEIITHDENGFISGRIDEPASPSVQSTGSWFSRWFK